MESTEHFSIAQNFSSKKVFQLVSVANQFESNILIELNEKKLNAKSLLSVGMLHGLNGRICVHAEGTDSKTALHELKRICLD
ncbi:HPr family phosphocarrier protein [Halalkalibacter krulwichiae]|uniref:Phosphocarrier protein HPr n=1 Tax=Halalkalibacter krulwichiae TaxID=199441 RepID=A0A1X9MDQ5_9BACI|nr:HPr family phosphocarrier protein [Halalkalibacter krulwichiae]ARK31546.1 Phosphocarrier protein HPr [Halalkalibacter krulwichiae]